jgi:hypothetical protein
VGASKSSKKKPGGKLTAKTSKKPMRGKRK